ncbi:hypothetical protein ACOZ38_35750 [Sphaerisporangium viridialbum]|uniref:hypothetical protein n=1 Tax=Sphaerisporangium viridialbum TaxID=46189 RepID=UPI003C78577F
MGHASPRAALIYQHATQDRGKVIAEALGQALKVAREGTPEKRRKPATGERARS